MNPLLFALESIVTQLNSQNIKYAIVGGFAVSFYGYERTTKDIDLAIMTDSDRESEKIIQQLFAYGFTQKAILEHQPSGRLATIRLNSPRLHNYGSVVVDLLFASSGIENEIVHEAKSHELTPNLTVNIASVVHLITMKVLAFDPFSRAQDGADIMALLKLLNDEEIAKVKVNLELITERGFERGKDLQNEFKKFIKASNKKDAFFKKK
jgi:hypothetical protein